MKNFDDYMAIALNNEKKALRIIEQSLIIPAWEKAGAKVNLIGSLKTRTLAKHLDIDFHIYTPELNIARSFAVMAQIAANPHIKHIEFTNLADTDECCYEWHARFEDCDKALWQIDMIQILSGSKYDGYFEKQAEKLDRKNYFVKIKYAHDDESEMVIRILSFGPMAEVTGSESFKKLIIEKLKEQLNCGLK